MTKAEVVKDAKHVVATVGPYFAKWQPEKAYMKTFEGVMGRTAEHAAAVTTETRRQAVRVLKFLGLEAAS